MKVYQQRLMDRVKEQCVKWRRAAALTHQEVYAFLHMIKGTAGSIGLDELEHFATVAMPYYNEKSLQELERSEIEQLTQSFLSMVANKQGSEYAIRSENLILIVTESQKNMTELKNQIQMSGYQVAVAPTFARGLQTFYDLQPGLVLVEMTKGKPYGKLQEMIERARKRFVPVAILSEDRSVEQHIAAYEIGATDFIGLPLQLPIFIPYVNNRLALRQDLQRSVVVDEMTGAFNRRHLNQTLVEYCARYERSLEGFSFILLDLDHFKKVNDTYGHLVGDEVLRRFSQLIQQMKRDTDLFFRYGGEEFALLLPNASPEAAVKVSDRMRKAFEKERFTSDERTFSVSFSAGVTEISGHNHHPAKLIEEADQALYTSKMNGRARTTIFEDSGEALHREQVVRILIVDDDSIIRDMLTRQFRKWKDDRFTIRVAAYKSGEVFLKSDWYQPGEKHVILLDGIMPGMDGIDVLRRMKQQYPEKDLLVSMLTARAEESSMMTALELGADDYIAKPFATMEVVSHIQRLVKAKLS